MSDELPRGWCVARVSDVTEVVPSIDPTVSPEKDFGYVDISAIDNSTFRITDLKRFLGKDAPSRARRPIRPNDVLFSNVRTYLRNIALVPPKCEAQVCSTGFTVLRPNGAVDPTYLFRYVLTNDFIDRVTPLQTGTHYPATSDRVVMAETMPLPPLAEQRRIVAKLEQALARIDASKQRLAKIPVLLKRFRQSVLVAACSGRLTADWRENNVNVEDAGVLLEHMAIERRQTWELRYTGRKYNLPETIVSEELPELPASWQWTNFDHCTSEITVGHVGPMKDRYKPEGVAFLRSQNVRPLRFDPLGLVRIPNLFHRELSKSELRGGEILVVRSGANTGDCCVFPHNLGAANCSDLVISRPLSGLVAEYGAMYVSSPLGQALLSIGQTGIAQPHFNIGAMRVKAFPLPPLPEQHEIVRRVEALFKLADQIEARFEKARAQIDKLTPALLAKAFRGELVPQDPADEPASVLLARIRAERTAAAENPAPKRRRPAAV